MPASTAQRGPIEHRVAIFHIHLILFFNLFELPQPTATLPPQEHFLPFFRPSSLCHASQLNSSRDDGPDVLPHRFRAATCFSQSVMSLFDCHRSFLPSVFHSYMHPSMTKLNKTSSEHPVRVPFNYKLIVSSYALPGYLPTK